MSLFKPLPKAPAIREDLAATARGYATEAQALNTRKTYAYQVAVFVRWCEANDLPSLPVTPQVLAAWVSDRAKNGASVSTITVGVAAVARANRLAGGEDPTDHPIYREVSQGIARVVGRAPRRQAKPLLPEQLRAISEAAEASGTPIALRTRAMLLLGFAGALRQSELVGLDVRDLRSDKRGFSIVVRKSKVDQTGVGREAAIARGTGASDPERAVRAWLEAAGITEGAVFRSTVPPHARLSTRSVERTVTDALVAIGEDPAGYSGHSMRSGLATASNASEVDIMRQGGWARMETMLRYRRKRNLHDNNPADGLL